MFKTIEPFKVNYVMYMVEVVEDGKICVDDTFLTEADAERYAQYTSRNHGHALVRKVEVINLYINGEEIKR